MHLVATLELPSPQFHFQVEELILPYPDTLAIIEPSTCMKKALLKREQYEACSTFHNFFSKLKLSHLNMAQREQYKCNKLYRNRTSKVFVSKVSVEVFPRGVNG